MAAQTSEDLLALLDQAPLNRRYWQSFALLGLVYIFDFFDFSLIAFIMAVIGPQWHLTYGQVALVFYGSGIGAVFGSLAWGSLGEVFGQRLQTVTGTLICGVAAGLIGFLPEGAYVALAGLRILVGFGLAAAITPALTIVVELTPTRWRTSVTSFFVLTATLGGLLASATSAILLHALSWRGIAMLGFLPVLVGGAVWLWVPESMRWLMAKGHFSAAQATAARHLAIDIGSLPLPTTPPAAPPRASLAELYQSPRLFWQSLIVWGCSTTAAFGYLLWGPTIVALALHKPVPQAAKYFFYVGVVAMVGRVLAALVVHRVGRRPVGIVFGFGSAVALAIAGWFNAAVIAGFPLFVVLIAGAAFFVEGGLSNIAPYTIEQYGVRLGSRASGLGHAAAGIGKITGPLTLALIAGTGNLMQPQATAAAVFPALMFLAVDMLAVALAFVFLARETHGQAMALEFADGGAAPPRAACPRGDGRHQTLAT